MNKLAHVLKLLLTFLLLQDASSFAVGNRLDRQSLSSTRPLNVVDQRQLRVKGLHSIRHRIPYRTSIIEVRGGSSPDSDSSTAQPSLYQKWSQFAGKNFFLLGMFVAVGLARALPAVSGF